MTVAVFQCNLIYSQSAGFNTDYKFTNIFLPPKLLIFIINQFWYKEQQVGHEHLHSVKKRSMEISVFSYTYNRIQDVTNIPVNSVSYILQIKQMMINPPERSPYLDLFRIQLIQMYSRNEQNEEKLKYKQKQYTPVSYFIFNMQKED